MSVIEGDIVFTCENKELAEKIVSLINEAGHGLSDEEIYQRFEEISPKACEMLKASNKWGKNLEWIESYHPQLVEQAKFEASMDEWDEVHDDDWRIWLPSDIGLSDCFSETYASTTEDSFAISFGEGTEGLFYAAFLCELVKALGADTAEINDVFMEE